MVIHQTDFNLEQIAGSGQCFRMNPLGPDSFGITAFQNRLEITQQGDEFHLSCQEEEFERIWRPYFDLDTDYGSMKARVDEKDAFMQQAIALGGGIRILRQELWEMVISFVISQNNNIARIKKNIETLCSKFGQPIEVADACCLTRESGTVSHAFPTPKALAALSLTELAGCGLGYRDKYILCAARAVTEGQLDLKALPFMEYEEARQALMSVCGIGVKVADCICLFGLYHIEAFPIDTHVKKLLAEHYPKGFPFERYDGFAGVLQQYGFYAQLSQSSKKRGEGYGNPVQRQFLSLQ